MTFVLLSYNDSLPDINTIADYTPSLTSHTYAADGTLIATYGEKNRVYIPYKNISPLVIQAFITAEDRNFFHHSGLDYKGIFRAILHNITSEKRLQGASTITQQLSRNIFLNNERSLSRKIKEILLALRLEKAFSKEQIIELYLNEIYLGSHAYGIASAANRYFNKAHTKLTLAEAATLAALPKAPSSANPYSNPEKVLKRRNWIIASMEKENYINAEQAHNAIATPMKIASSNTTSYFSTKYFSSHVEKIILNKYLNENNEFNGLYISTSLDRELQQFAKDSLQDGLLAYSKRHGYHGKIGTITLANTWQDDLLNIAIPPGADNLVSAVILNINDKDKLLTIGLHNGGKLNIKFRNIQWIWKNHPLAKERNLSIHDFLQLGDVILVDRTTTPATLSQIPKVEGAIVVMNPNTGDVLAMQGGFSYNRSPFNRVTQAKRQPGSAIKPFIYLAGLEKNYPPSYVIEDEPIDSSTLNTQDNQWQKTLFHHTKKRPSWSPRNASGYFYGATTLRNALEKSYNVATVRFALQLGLPAITSLFKRIELLAEDTPLPSLSSILGSKEVTLLELTNAYAIIANGGHKVTPQFINFIQNYRGETLYRKRQACTSCNERTNDPSLLLNAKITPPSIIDKRSAYQLTSILQGVIQNGTAIRARHLPFPVAGKTGTTNDSKDAWFIGYTSSLVVGVYVGFDIPESLGKNEQGASVALPIFVDFMKKAHKKYPGKSFSVPDNMEFIPIDKNTGSSVLSNTKQKDIILETFKAGNISTHRPHHPTPQETNRIY